jgi:hypothetical protein
MFPYQILPDLLSSEKTGSTNESSGKRENAPIPQPLPPAKPGEEERFAGESPF